MADYTENNAIYKGPHRLPDFGAEWGDLESWRAHFFRSEDNTYRERHMERMSLALHYALGNQDIDFNSNLHQTDSGYTFFSRGYYGGGGSEDDYPRPVTNYIDEAVKAETAALGKRKLVSKAVPTTNDPKVEIAAQEATNILNDQLKQLDWSEKRKEGLLYFVTCGSITYKTSWDELYSKTKVVGSSEAVHCPDCGLKLQSPIITADQRAKIPQVPPQAAPEAKGRDMEHMLLACPECPDGVLEPYQVGQEELEEEDMFGRPMGQEVPVGQVALELYSPFQEFIENNGVGVSPFTVKLRGYVTPRSMDWLIERYPQLQEVHPDGNVTIKVEPDSPDLMMEHHPLLGEAALRYTYATGVGDPSIYDDHKLVYEVIQEKNYRFPKGRYAVMVRGFEEPLEDGPLYLDVPHPTDANESLEVPKVKFHTARYRIRAGEWYGKGMPDDLISPQNVLNALDSIAVDTFERMGSPNLSYPESLNLQGPEWHEGYGAGRHYRWELDPLNPQLKPEVIEGRSPASALFNFRNLKSEDLKRLGATKDVEIGEAPRNITTTTGLQLLSEQADRMRADAEDALVSIYESMWKHTLDLLWAFRVEEDEEYYETKTPSGAWERKQLKNTLIAGQTQVKIEKQAYVDKSVFWKEAVREAQLDGLYDPNSPMSPSVRIALLEARGLPTEMVESENLQVKAARRQWIDFKDEGILPTIDVTLDNPHIRFEELGNQLLTPEAQDIAEAAGWPEISRNIAGWQDTFMAALQADQAAREFYGGWQPKEVREQLYNDATAQYEQQVAEYQAVQQETANITLQDPQTAVPEGYLAPPPEPPPLPQFLPNSMEDKILAVWTQLLNQAGPLPEPTYPELINPTNPEEGQMKSAEKQQDFLKFRAVIEAYKVLADQDIQAQQLGEMQSPAPSSEGGERVSPFSSPKTPPTGGVKV